MVDYAGFDQTFTSTPRNTSTSPGSTASPSIGASNARDAVASALRQFGLDDLADWVIKNIKDNADELTIYLELRKSAPYKARFPAMEEMQRQANAGGRGFTEADYIQLENAYRQVLSGSGLPPEMWDSHGDYAALMTNQVSAAEVADRVAAAKQAVDSTDAATRTQLQRLYGLTADDLMAYALVPKRASSYINRVATTAIMAGMGADQGIGGGLTQAQWEQYGGTAVAEQMGQATMREAIGSAADLLTQQRRLAAVEGTSFTDTDALDVAVRKDAARSLQSQQRARREKARFSGSSGISSGTLRGEGA